MTKAEIEHLANLSRISLPQQEDFYQNFLNLLTFVEDIKNINVENIKPTLSPVTLNNVFREDKITPSLSQEEALLNAPQKKDGFFVIPKVL